MSTISIEIAPFRRAAGTSQSALDAASRRLETDFLETLPGYLGRLVLQQGDDRFIDLAIWASRADADAAGEKAKTSETCAAYFACMADADPDAPEAGVEHYAVIAAFGQARTLTELVPA
ncbi:hypothetical protein [Bauldia sp.]|uniref:hypothetical protein n=1 Tax=Bauldia sp. TaxID=2575872 RepID=UPI003BA9A12B